MAFGMGATISLPSHGDDGTFGAGDLLDGTNSARF
ncbi:MAG: hypothetical protein RLZZ591_1678 [Pseudomonadota bacterium]|jgi:hypothetical protein